MTLLSPTKPSTFSFRRKGKPAGTQSETIAEVIYFGQPDPTFEMRMEAAGYQYSLIQTREEAIAALRAIGLRTRPRPAFLLVEHHPAAASWWRPILKLRWEDALLRSIPLILLGMGPGESRRGLAETWAAADVFDFPFAPERLARRLNFLEEEADYSEETTLNAAEEKFRIPLAKRLFDILVASTVLLLLSPLLLLVALLIKLESRGPIFYISKRVGTGYQVFPFMKFRSMRVGADRELKSIDHLNQYNEGKEPKQTSGSTQPDIDSKILAEAADWNHWVIDDHGTLPEAEVKIRRSQEIEQSFVKVVNDPRVTRVGRFIRNTSIDELPQLLNVLRGDMSIVGNRPLPLYEAEKLTSDDWTLRFMAPAGITGWWQVTERGKSNLDPDSRKARDVEYAQNYSFWMDLKILWMTIPALFQQENV